MNLTDQEKIRIAKNEYAKKWRKNNPEKIRQYNERHFLKKYNELMEQSANENKADPMEVKIMDLHSQGLSLRKIADLVGINHVSVSRIIKSNKL